MSEWKHSYRMGGATDIVLRLKDHIALIKNRLGKYDKEKMPFDILVLETLEGLIEENYRQHKALGFYCQQLNINLYRLNVIIRHHIGKTLHVLLQDRIHEEARNLLTYTNQSVKEIAFELGFSDHPYFSRHFKNLEGISPVAYRKAVGHGLGPFRLL